MLDDAPRPWDRPFDLAQDRPEALSYVEQASRLFSFAKCSAIITALALFSLSSHLDANVLDTDKLKTYVERFNADDEERYAHIPNADAYYARLLVAPNEELLVDLLDDLILNYEAWESAKLGAKGLFYQIDDRDGMEVSIGGSGYRATINPYMYALVF